MSRPVKTVLYVRLPVWKIYPGGVLYVADFIHKQRPDIKQELLDMALIEPGRRTAALRARIEALKPDVVAFSWRNMQTFGPHPDLGTGIAAENRPVLHQRDGEAVARGGNRGGRACHTAADHHEIIGSGVSRSRWETQRGAAE